MRFTKEEMRIVLKYLQRADVEPQDQQVVVYIVESIVRFLNE